MSGLRFEKWQALGNDYVIVERDALPFVLTPARIRRLCDVHTGIGSDGILELAPSPEPGYVAALRIHNPDGSEAELSGNGAREAALYLRRAGWTDSAQFSIATAAGEIRPTLLSERECRLDMGTARVPEEAVLEAAGRAWHFHHILVGNPQTAIRMGDPAELEALDLAVAGPPICNHARFPGRTNVSFWREQAADRIRARIFERGVGETSASGTGACGAAIAHVLRGGDSPVTVELDGGQLVVDVDESLHFTLTGEACPVFSGELSPELLTELEALQ